MNLAEKLMKLDRKKLEEVPTGEIEIKRLSQLTGEPFTVKCRAIPGERYTEIGSVMTDHKGKLDLGKVYRVNTLLAVEGVVEPDLRDAKLQEHFSCKTPKDLAEVLFQGGEMSKVGDLITELSGFGEESDNEIKN
ncbi:hypothetical protein DS742_05190 [Lacrimispora amygdalina]|uniref:XkdN-like protein n=1 Tax=Lacrimispora amygdalina TaxID=253257 RepID=A0A3E2NFR9_9FIRM|nr:hypothetical protein [Clostridium indicum]RFZ79857.1 hypothetical protein DS742_05190 [Clostridium indicum]